MTDPFDTVFHALRAETGDALRAETGDALRAETGDALGIGPTMDPDPDFTARLRSRIERALTLPRGVVVSDTALSETSPDETSAQAAAAGPLGAAIPYLAVGDARAAIQWYGDIFGAEVSYDPIVMPDGRVGHCELSLAGGKIYLADEHPEIGVVAPSPDACAVSLMLAVDDADAVHGRAVADGATSYRDPSDSYGHRSAWIIDPFGHRWGLNSPLSAPATGGETADGPGHGDVVYASLQVADPTQAAAFYRSVLDWDVAGEASRYSVSGQSLPLAILGDPSGTGLFTVYAVDDLGEAARRVRAAGGSATEPAERPYGRIVDCVDDQGTAFAVWQRDPGATEETSAAARQGDLSYLTYQVRDSRAFRDFYGAVLGWTFSPGRVEDGWQISGSTPMGGVAGGHDRPAAVAMWQVDDIAAAVERVRAAGGNATEPQRQPYGLMSECTDDQGIAFYLGQF